MAIPPITALPPAPLRSQNPATFTTTAENFVDALGNFITETNAAIDEINALSFSTNSWKGAVRVATTAAITLATDLEAGDSIDGVTLATGDRVLVKDQATASENGVYVVAASGAPARAADMNANDEVLGAVVFVIAGTTNGNKIFYSTNTSAVTIGSSNLTFAEFTGAAAYTDALARAAIHAAPTPISGTSHTAVIGNAYGYLRFTNGSPITFTIPADASVDFPDGAVIAFEQAGAGVVTLDPDTGVTINSRGGALDTAGQFAVGQIKKVGPDEWTAIGDLA